MHNYIGPMPNFTPQSNISLYSNGRDLLKGGMAVGNLQNHKLFVIVSRSSQMGNEEVTSVERRPIGNSLMEPERFLEI